ncbi:hypothetical protein EDF56_102420 [Novosphingobium sp. PhB165]|uniref:hypothetical protein n=1 Tax=Novosphingobium sp. PhB165 TaxID=2485105 RepID=UPI00104A942E|nr:hypothetical protein [Novosphingobium sp. PhB165]TCM20757.1 hypothetical protein EDF56_102420 [Novosphingobium sp. PhB165]
MSRADEKWERSYKRRKLALFGLAVLLSCLMPVVIGIAGDEGAVFPKRIYPSYGIHLPLPARIAVALAFAICLGLLARLNWRASDEVRRAHMLAFGAATGRAVGFTFFGFLMFGNEIPEAARLPLAFLLPIMAGLAFVVTRWFRDGYVW